MGELIGLAKFAEAKRRQLAADYQAESRREERAEALLEAAHRYRMSAQRLQRRRQAVSLSTNARHGPSGPPL